MEQNLEIILPSPLEVVLPSPYLLLPQQLSLPTNNPVLRALESIAYPADLHTNPYYETRNAYALLTYRNLVCHEFFKRRAPIFENPYCKPPRKPKVIREIIDLETKLWLSVWYALEFMEKLSLLRKCTSDYFTAIVKESALVTPMFGYVEPDDRVSARDWYYKRQTAINTLLRGGDDPDVANPFDSTKHHHTWLFIELAQRLAGKRNGQDAPIVPPENTEHFRKEFYMRMVTARASLIRALRESNPCLHGQDKISTQGRRLPAKKSKQSIVKNKSEA